MALMSMFVYSTYIPLSESIRMGSKREAQQSVEAAHSKCEKRDGIWNRWSEERLVSHLDLGLWSSSLEIASTAVAGVPRKPLPNSCMHWLLWQSRRAQRCFRGLCLLQIFPGNRERQRSDVPGNGINLPFI